MLLKLQPYNYIIKYEPGYMNASDALSRNPLPSDVNAVSEDTEHFINNIISDAYYAYYYHQMKLKVKHYQTMIYVQLFKV